MATESLRAVPAPKPDVPGLGPDESASQMTVEQLAAESGMSVRNIRAHQARGLLPPPEVRQRVGYYGAEHLARLRLITELQADGFNLKGIERLLEGANGESSAAMLSFRRALTAPFETERPEIVSLMELRERLGTSSPKMLARALKMGLVTPVGPASFEVPSPRLLTIAGEVIDRGVTLEAALDVVAVAQRSSGYVAEAFVKLFLEQVWQPFEDDGRPPEDWPKVLESIERLRPIASEALVSVFQMTMSEEVEEAFGRELARLSGQEPPRRKRRH
ncbi:MAG: MerR family transcriptional regulator [Actinomycetota bacterium]|nr:MerR family transcriptional regulator [Actinomycetota bacterium]